MAQTKVSVRTLHDAPTAVGRSGHRTLTIDRPEEAGGMGLGYSGGELPLLALRACFTNDILREVRPRGIEVRAVVVEVQGDWVRDGLLGYFRSGRYTFAAQRIPERCEDPLV
jgi:uncharacterized OsmC-like protein